GHDGDERGHGGGEHGILSGHDGTHGPGDSGEGIAAGASGDRALRGRGTAHGRSGEADGSTRPSWNRVMTAEIDTDSGGRTPEDAGKRGGSAGGDKDGDGRALGLGLWGGLIDAPEAIAPLVMAGMIILDADLVG